MTPCPGCPILNIYPYNRKDSGMKKSTKTNIIFALVVLAIAAAFLIAGLFKPKGNVAVLTYGFDGAEMRIPLNEDHRYDIESGKYTIHLEVKDQQIRFVESPCPDHVCESYGWLSQEGDFAACLPAFAAVVIEPAK